MMLIPEIQSLLKLVGRFLSDCARPAAARLGVNVRYDMLYIYLHLGRGETEPLFTHLEPS